MMIVTTLQNGAVMRIFRCFSDVKTAAKISIAPGWTTKLDLELFLENSGLVCTKIRILGLSNYSFLFKFILFMGQIPPTTFSLDIFTTSAFSIV